MNTSLLPYLVWTAWSCDDLVTLSVFDPRHVHSPGLDLRLDDRLEKTAHTENVSYLRLIWDLWAYVVISR